MPFRYNFIGDPVIQPNTDWAEIDLKCLDLGISGATPSLAVIITTFDSQFKIGGEIICFGQNDEADEGEDDPIEITLQFDNFGTVASARAWLEEIGFTTIEETN